MKFSNWKGLAQPLASVCTAAHVFLGLPAYAQNIATSSGDFTNPAVWTGSVPNTSDGENDVRINNGANVTVSGGSVGVYGLIRVGRDGSNDAASALTIAGGTFHIGGNEASGISEFGGSDGQPGILNVASGLATFNDRGVRFGEDVGATGRMTVSGGSVVFDDQLFIGNNGMGILEITGGHVITGDDMRVASESGSVGTVMVTGGMLQTNTQEGGPLAIGRHGTGTVMVSGGTIFCGPTESIGRRNAGVEGRQLHVGDGTGLGRLVLQGPNSVVKVADRFRIGRGSSTGIVEVHGGTLTSDGQLIVGAGNGSVGTLVMTSGYIDTDHDNNTTNFRRLIVGGGSSRGQVEVSGGTLDIGGNLWVGDGAGGVGTLLQSGGLILPASAAAGGQSAHIGRLEGTTGFLCQSGGTLIHAPGTSDEFPFHVGSEGNGVLEIKDSAVFMTTDHLSVATSANAEGVLRISGGSVSALELSIGVRGDGVGIIGGAAKVSVATDMNVGSDSGGIGSLTVGGNAALDVGASALIGAGGSSVSAVNVTGTGPAIDIALDLNIGGGLSSNAAFNMSGGTLTVFRDTFLGSSSQSNAVLNYTGGSLALGGTLSILGEATLHIASPLLLQVTKGFHPGLALGEKLDVAGLILPAPNLDHVSAETGSAFFIQVGDRTGASGGEDFRTNTALEGLGLTGLSTPPGATRIPEVEFESGNFNPFTESVFALVEELIAGQLGRVGLRWTIAPVPPPPEILADFAAGNGLPADPYDNSDKDDATLLAEFAFNRDPTVNESLSLTPGTGTAGMPFISAVNLGENPHIRVEYIRRTKTTAPELTYSVQFGNSLATLMDYSGPETVIPIDPYWERVIVDDAETAATQPRRFGRVKVDYTPTP